MKSATPLPKKDIKKAKVVLDPILDGILKEIMCHVPMTSVADSLSDLWEVRLNPKTVIQSFEDEYRLKVPCYPDPTMLVPLYQYSVIQRILKIVKVLKESHG